MQAVRTLLGCILVLAHLTSLRREPLYAIMYCSIFVASDLVHCQRDANFSKALITLYLGFRLPHY